MATLPIAFLSQTVAGAGVNLHVVHNLREGETRPVLVCLHGFPEFWIAWRDVFVHLADDFAIIAPDQRGFNLSDAPPEVEAYATKKMVADLIAICDTLAPGKPIHIAGHDWGASIAYAAAIALPDRIKTLTIANGVHPVCFQRAIMDDPDQRLASQYMNKFKRDGFEKPMSENGFARSFAMFEQFSATPWLEGQTRQDYHDAWSRPGRMKAMLNWYRGSPIEIPETGAPANHSHPLYAGDQERFRVTMPHLLIWGDGDQALRPSAKAELSLFAPNLTQHSISGADHWLLHTHGAEIAETMRTFISAQS